VEDSMKVQVIGSLEEDNLFLTGGAGTGKSYLTREVIRFYDQLGKKVITLGSTGISAINIGGFTIHSFFAFGISSHLEELVSYDKRNKTRLKEMKKILEKTHLLIIDEISMVSASLLDMISYRLRSLGYSGRVMFVGDFFQLPPIIKNTPDGLFDEAVYAFESDAWEHFNPIMVALTKMQRTTDKPFTKILRKIRLGVCDEDVHRYLSNLEKNTDTYENNPTFLYGRNKEADATNKEKLALLKEKEYILVAEEEVIYPKIDERRVSSWKKLLPINESLHLKVGVPVLFTINKHGKFYNGERGIIKAIDDNFLIILKGEALLKVEKHDFELTQPEVNKKGELEDMSMYKLSQYPIKLAYAITIHKSQGMSIDNLVCNIDHIFTPSQFYVAISRATDPKRLKIEYNGHNFPQYVSRTIHIDAKVLAFYLEVVEKQKKQREAEGKD